MRQLSYLWRILSGKSVFGSIAYSPQKAEPAPQTARPIVQVLRCTSRHDAQRMYCDIELHNRSARDITITRITIFDKTRRYNRRITAGERRQFYNALISDRLYEPTNAKCLITFRNHIGKYYCLELRILLTPTPGTHDSSRVISNSPIIKPVT